MRLVIQRVSKSKVEVDGETVGSIAKGLCVLLGISNENDESKFDWVINKILNLRVFNDEDGKMNLSLNDIQGEILVISNFTLYGDARKGLRPSYTDAANPEAAEEIYHSFMKKLRESTNLKVEEGKFQAYMDLSISNDGPVTLIIEK